MPRKAEPSFELKLIIWDVAAAVGKDKPTDIQRQLDYAVEKRRKEEGNFFEGVPDVRTISRIVNEINKLDPEVVVAKLPSHVWKLRDDYEAIKRLGEGVSQASQKEIDSLVAKVQEEHLSEIRTLVEKWHAAVQEFILVFLRMDKIRLGPNHIPLRLNGVTLDPLFESLKQHLPSKDLWEVHSEWCDEFQRYWHTDYKIKEDIVNQSKLWPNVQISKHNFVKPIIYQISHLCIGFELYDLNFRYLGKSLYIDGITPEDPSDTFHFSILTADRPADYIERYKSLVNNILQSEEVENLVILDGQLFDNERRIEWKLQEMLLRRDYIWHTCRLCPRQAGFINRE